MSAEIVPTTVHEGNVVATREVIPQHTITMYECFSAVDVKPCDVLSIVGVGAPPAWRFNKYIIPQKLMEEMKITFAYCYVSDNSLEAWELLLERAKPRVVIVRGMIMDEVIAEVLAVRYPCIQFVHICHSSVAFATTEFSVFPRSIAVILLTLRYANIHYAHPNYDEVEAMRCVFNNEACSIIWLPNVVESKTGSTRTFDKRRANVFLACVWRDQKNMVGQMLAVAAASRQRPLQFYLSIPDVGRDGFIKSMIDTVNRIPDFKVNMVEWKVNEDFVEWMAHNIDMVMQCSFTESFNYVAWEAMDLGIPVITSPAISFGTIQVNPDSIRQMSKGIIKAFDEYGKWSQVSRELARGHGEDLNLQYIRQLTELLNKRC